MEFDTKDNFTSICFPEKKFIFQDETRIWDNSHTPNILEILERCVLPNDLKSVIERVYLEYASIEGRDQCNARTEQLAGLISTESEKVQFNPVEDEFSSYDQVKPSHVVLGISHEGRRWIIDLTHDQFSICRVGPVIQLYEDFEETMKMLRYKVA